MPFLYIFSHVMALIKVGFNGVCISRACYPDEKMGMMTFFSDILGECQYLNFDLQ